MLKHLFIQNYTLIDKLNLGFEKGFSVITGETGAGKSIIIGAIGMIMGNRADSSVLLDKEKKCIVEGTFAIKGYGYESFFSKHELDYEDDTILRREIGTNGKSRAFINDTPVNLNTFKELSVRLLDIHSQHETLTLGNLDFQINIVDNYANILSDIGKYSKLYVAMKQTEKLLNEFKESYSRNKSDLDYFQFQFDELDKAKFVLGEQEEIERELEVLNHAEEIKSVLNQLDQGLSSSEENIVNQLNQIEQNLQRIAAFHPQLGGIKERISSAIIELNDLSAEGEQLNAEIEYAPERADELNERLDLIYKLQQKHNLQTIEELLELKKELEHKILNIETSESDIKELQEKMESLQKNVLELATKISNKRKKVFPHIEKEIKSTLAKLGMKDAEFKINLDTLESPNEKGIDKIKFLFNANLGMQAKELSKVASGGELSRLMLSIKSLISQSNLLPTIVFDEIDNGVSGDVAAKVGDILQSMSASMQVMAITHLPQIAGKANVHYKVSKESGNKSTRSKIQRLNNEERIIEIAKILSGETITDSAMNTAKELLKTN